LTHLPNSFTIEACFAAHVDGKQSRLFNLLSKQVAMHQANNLAQVLSLPSQAHHHSHSYAQMVIGLHGKTEFDIQGRGQAVGPGDGCLLPASTEHAFNGLANNQILVVNVVATAQPSLQDKLEHLFRHPSYFQLSQQTQLLIRALGQELLLQPHDPLLAESCANTLVCILKKHLSSPLPSKRQGERLSIARIDSYIQQHLQHKISVAQLAGSVFMAESHFYALFRQQTGLSPHQYLLIKRLEQAKQLLIEPHFSIQQIAQLCGFASQSSFTTAFNRHFSLTPARFRRQFH